MRRRPLREFARKGEPMTREQLASWICSGQTFYWSVRAGRLCHDAPLPHGPPASEPARIIQSICGCICEQAARTAKAAAISEMRASNRTWERERALGRGDGPASGELEPDPDPMNAGRSLFRMDHPSPLVARFLTRAGRLLSGRAECFPNWSVCVSGSDGMLRLSMTPKDQSRNCLDLCIPRSWMLHVHATGLHDDLSDIVLDARRRGHLAQAIVWRGEHLLQGPNPDYAHMYQWEKVSSIFELECVRCDERWRVVSEKLLHRFAHNLDHSASLYRLRVRDGAPEWVCEPRRTTAADALLIAGNAGPIQLASSGHVHTYIPGRVA